MFGRRAVIFSYLYSQQVSTQNVKNVQVSHNNTTPYRVVIGKTPHYFFMLERSLYWQYINTKQPWLFYHNTAIVSIVGVQSNG